MVVAQPATTTRSLLPKGFPMPIVMAPLASPDDVEAALLRPLTDTEVDYVPTLIGQASALLRTAAPSIDDRIARYEADPTDLSGVSSATVATVVAGVVKKYLINPQGIASTSTTTGPYNESVSYALRSEKEERGVLQITAGDLRTLFPNRKRLRAGSIRMRPGLAPRPVGHYGPYPTLGVAIESIIDYAPELPLLTAAVDPLLLPGLDT